MKKILFCLLAVLGFTACDDDDPVTPVDPDVPVLTEAQKALVEGYKENLGFDASRIIGKLDCQVKVTFPDAEVGENLVDELQFSKDKHLTYNTQTVVTLSEKATADKPVFKMPGNAMGLSQFFKTILVKEIMIGDQVGTPFHAVAEYMGYKGMEEEFDLTLDNLTWKKDGSMEFLGKVFDSFDTELTGVPFGYDFSVWNRQCQMITDGVKMDLIVKDAEGNVVDEQLQKPMEEIVGEGMDFNPVKFLIYSDMTEDGWEEGMWQAPSSKVDFAKGEISFTFPWDHANSSDYTLIEVTYKMNPAK